MNRNDFEANWNDSLAQKEYAIYDQNGQFVGLADGHDADHALHKFAQFDERNPRDLKAEKECK